jgi:hypothetical protein
MINKSCPYYPPHTHHVMKKISYYHARFLNPSSVVVDLGTYWPLTRVTLNPTAYIKKYFLKLFIHN